MKVKAILAFLLTMFPLFAAAGPQKVIGVSQSSLDDAWRRAMVREMRIELSNYDHLDLLVYDAENAPERQIAQVRELAAKGVDILVVSPIEARALTEVTSEAFRSGIPTIVTDRKVLTEDYSVFIGADNYEIGRNAGRYALSVLAPAQKAPRILEIWGLEASSPAQERHEGFVKTLADAGVRPVWTRVYGDWKPEIADKALSSVPADEVFDIIYCHNDMMAISAYNHFVVQGGQDPDAVRIIGVDAVAGAGVDAVADGRIDVSFLYPTGGAEVIRAARALLAGEAVPKNITLASSLVDREGARTLVIQGEKMEDYLRSIEDKKTHLDQLNGHYRRLFILFLIVALVCVALALVVVFVRRAHRREVLRNQEGRQSTDQEQAESPDKASPSLPESPDEAFLRKFTTLIERVYAEPEYNVERLSSEMGISRGHLYRKVSELTGMSPVEYLGLFRLRKAKELLETTSLTINQVAYETGFSSPAYFTKRFREQFGRTPSDVRRPNL